MAKQGGTATRRDTKTRGRTPPKRPAVRSAASSPPPERGTDPVLLAVQKGDPAILDRLLKYNESCQKAKSRHLRQLVSLIGLLVLFALAMVLATIGGLENPRWVEVLLASAGGGASLPTLIERFGNSR